MTARCYCCRGPLILVKLQEGPDSYTCPTCDEPPLMLSHKQEFIELCDHLKCSSFFPGAVLRIIKQKEVIHDKLLRASLEMREACKTFLAAEKVFVALDPSNPDCGPEVIRYAQAKKNLKAILKKIDGE